MENRLCWVVLFFGVFFVTIKGYATQVVKTVGGRNERYAAKSRLRPRPKQHTTTNQKKKNNV